MNRKHANLFCLKKRFAIFFILLFSCFGQSLWATELEPWLSELYLPILRANFDYQVFKEVDTALGRQPYKAYDEFLDRSLQMTVKEDFSVEAEWGGCSTRQTNWTIEYLRATGRFQILNDIGGEDPLSLTAGLTLTFPWKSRLKDISLMHHSPYDAELHIAIGKEVACGPTWSERYWALLGYGQGTRGKGWLHVIAAAEKNFCNMHQCRIALEYLQGFSRNNITDLDLFPGYATIAHYSLDASIRYMLVIPTYFDVKFEYLYRIASRNCPYGIQTGSVGLIWPLTFLSN